MLRLLIALVVLATISAFNASPRRFKNHVLHMKQIKNDEMISVKKAMTTGMLAFGLGVASFATPVHAGMKGELKSFDAATYKAEKEASKEAAATPAPVSKSTGKETAATPAPASKSTAPVSKTTAPVAKLSPKSTPKPTQPAAAPVKKVEKKLPKFEFAEEQALYQAQENLDDFKVKAKSLEKEIANTNKLLKTETSSVNKINTDIGKLKAKINDASAEVKPEYLKQLEPLKKSLYETQKTATQYENAITRDTQQLESTRLLINNQKTFIADKKVIVKKKREDLKIKKKSEAAKIKADAAAKAKARKDTLMKDRTGKLNAAVNKKTGLEKLEKDVTEKISKTKKGLAESEKAATKVSKDIELEEKRLQTLTKLLEEKKKIKNIALEKNIEQEATLNNILDQKSKAIEVVNAAQQALKEVSK